MQTLNELTREAQALARGEVPYASLPLTDHEQEVARQLKICNACRYCEGFCAVFPAMTRRLEFSKADIHYLANLCTTAVLATTPVSMHRHTNSL